MAKRPQKRSRKAARKTTVRRRPAAAAPAPPSVAPALPPRGAEPPSRDGHRQVPGNFHALYDRGFRSARGMAVPAARAASASGRRMARTVPDLEIHYDEATQLPNMIVTKAPDGSLTAPARAGVRRRARAARTPEGAAVQFIRSRSDLWRLSPQDAETIEVVSVSEPQEPPSPPRARAGRGRGRAAAAASFDISRMKTVNLIQRVDGVEVFNSDTTAAVNPTNDVVAMAGQFFAGAASTTARSRGARLRSRGRLDTAAMPLTPAEDAIARAAFDLTNVAYSAGDFSRAPDPSESGPYRFYEYTARARDTRPAFERAIRVKDVVFPLGEGEFVPGYYMELFIKGYPAFSYVMDAVETPDLLYRKNLTSHVAFRYRVHNTGDALFRPEDGPAPGTPHPTGKPDGFQAKPIAEKLITVESLLSGDPWLPANATTTEGNNCIAYADLATPDGFGRGDVKGKASAPAAFDYTYNHKKASTEATNLQNSLVGMFFHVNWLHDRWYEAGFDEASGNAQKSNFGRGGVGGDPVLAEGSDFSGTDNANMSTPADGHSPRMQMYTFTGTNPTRTSNHEALITFHEMGHYITNRLIGNANGLTNTQGEAMGEGWGDFFAACMTSQAADNFATGTFAVGGWTDLAPGFKENYYFSIRRYPYSADMKKNPLTFKHIGNNVVLPAGPAINPSPAGNNEVHNAGEVWCSALWEVFVNLVAKHKHQIAEKRMLAYVIGGLKLTPIRPTFIQARDAIIAAVAALDPADLPTVKAGFAKRGMGAGAVAPPSNSTSLAGVVESFKP